MRAHAKGIRADAPEPAPPTRPPDRKVPGPARPPPPAGRAGMTPGPDRRLSTCAGSRPVASQGYRSAVIGALVLLPQRVQKKLARRRPRRRRCFHKCGCGQRWRPGLPMARRLPHRFTQNRLHSRRAGTRRGSCGLGAAGVSPRHGWASRRRTAPRPHARGAAGASDGPTFGARSQPRPENWPQLIHRRVLRLTAQCQLRAGPQPHTQAGARVAQPPPRERCGASCGWLFVESG